MNNRVAFLERAYRLFNDREIDALFEMMTPDVEWPDAPRSAVLRGPSEIRPHWEGQFFHRYSFEGDLVRGWSCAPTARKRTRSGPGSGPARGGRRPR